MKYSKKCPYCGAVNSADAGSCKNCYESLFAVMAEIEEDNNQNKFYKLCPVCGEKNYIDYKDQFLARCHLCNNNKINDVPSQIDNVKKETIVRPLTREEIKRTTNFQTSETRVKRLALRSTVDFHIVNIPDREGIIGRYGNIDSEYFKGIDHISGNHLLFYYDKGECRIEDLNSTNGTRLNGMRLRPQQKYSIKKGDKILISKLEFEVVEV